MISLNFLCVLQVSILLTFCHVIALPLPPGQEVGHSAPHPPSNELSAGSSHSPSHLGLQGLPGPDHQGGNVIQHQMQSYLTALHRVEGGMPSGEGTLKEKMEQPTAYGLESSNTDEELLKKMYETRKHFIKENFVPYDADFYHHWNPKRPLKEADHLNSLLRKENRHYNRLSILKEANEPTGISRQRTRINLGGLGEVLEETHRKVKDAKDRSSLLDRFRRARTEKTDELIKDQHFHRVAQGFLHSTQVPKEVHEAFVAGKYDKEPDTNYVDHEIVEKEHTEQENQHSAEMERGHDGINDALQASMQRSASYDSKYGLNKDSPSNANAAHPPSSASASSSQTHHDEQA